MKVLEKVGRKRWRFGEGRSAVCAPLKGTRLVEGLEHVTSSSKVP